MIQGIASAAATATTPFWKVLIGNKQQQTMPLSSAPAGKTRQGHNLLTSGTNASAYTETTILHKISSQNLCPDHAKLAHTDQHRWLETVVGITSDVAL